MSKNAASKSCQPRAASLRQRLRAMPSSLNDACRTMEEADERFQKLEGLLERSRQILAMLIEPNAIKTTTVMHAWAQATELEAAIRAALSAPAGNGDVGNG